VTPGRDIIYDGVLEVLRQWIFAFDLSANAVWAKPGSKECPGRAPLTCAIAAHSRRSTPHRRHRRLRLALRRRNRRHPMCPIESSRPFQRKRALLMVRSRLAASGGLRQSQCSSRMPNSSPPIAPGSRDRIAPLVLAYPAQHRVTSQVAVGVVHS
jgi:hypothetical protein